MVNLQGYQAVDAQVALADRTDRVRLDVAGPDRAKFLHNLTTNEVKRLPVGRGCEAFVTSPQGKTLAYVVLLACPDSILVRADHGGAVLAWPHLQKYGVFDDIALEDRSESTFEFHLAGPQADELVHLIGGTVPEPADYAHIEVEIAGCRILVVRETPTGRSGLTLIGARQNHGKVADLVRRHGSALGLADLDQETFDVLRIEAGTPIFGRDVTEKNLPQEIGRDDAAISFVKGCYLGQETVARIDAIGHVNQVLKGLRLETGSPCPSPGAELNSEGRRVGFVTSSTCSPGWNSPIALALLRTTHVRAGTEVTVNTSVGGGPTAASVCDLPMIPHH